MRFRGHAWRATNEMAASMVLPTIAVVGLLGLGIDDVATLSALQHGLMLPAMLVAMLLRREEYSGGAHTLGHVRPVAA